MRVMVSLLSVAANGARCAVLPGNICGSPRRPAMDRQSQDPRLHLWFSGNPPVPSKPASPVVPFANPPESARSSASRIAQRSRVAIGAVA